MAGTEIRRFIDKGCWPSAGKPAIFIDRDGVLNEDLAYVFKPEDINWTPGVFEFCKSALLSGYCLVVITNQSGIARGYYSETEFLDLTRWFHNAFAQRSAPLTSTWYCPHHPEFGATDGGTECSCRKPKPGLILAASEFYDFDLTRSIMIGDRQRDIEAGIAAGITKCFQYGPLSFAQIADACGFEQGRTPTFR